MRRYILPVLVVLLLLGGCATQKGKREKSLDLILSRYASALRWNSFEDGFQFVDPEWLKAHPLTSVDIQRYRQVRVSSYNANPPVPTGPDDVEQLVQIGVINEHSQSERSIIDRQHWHWDEAKLRWWLTTGPPDITRHD